MGSSLRIEWYGHAYFLVKYDDYSIAIDPHDGGSLNLPEFRIKADAVLVTHNHYDHNAVEMVDAREVVKWRKGSFQLGPFKVEGIQAYHDKSMGKLRGENIIYRLEAGSFSIVHVGDLGHIPGDDVLEKLKGVSILMVPVGGTYTIDAEEAWELITKTEPRLVIPMHYWVPYSTLPLDPLDKFLSISKARRLRLDSRVLEVTPDDIPDKTTIVIMPPPTKKH
ncbi:MAG: MBL fold metallo-hydrolase [Crenarchaeota archaeon]|nr:MBL fold metallo-hydrolase [Thermoproteota archaeon]